MISFGSERLQSRMMRAIDALSKANVSFALSGSNATLVWIANCDESGIRYSRNIEVLLQRSDIERALIALARAGFVEKNINGRTYFYDFEPFRQRFANEITFAGEVSEGRCAGCVAPEISETEVVNGIPVVSLNALARLQLGRYRLDDAVDVRDMIGVGMIDQSWTLRLPPLLGERLQGLLDDPDG